MSQVRDYSDDVTTAKRMFMVGFIGFPLIWVMLVANYWKMSREVSAPSDLKFYVNGALIGALVLLSAYFGWIAYFQLNWETMGEMGRNLLVVGVTLPSDW